MKHTFLDRPLSRSIKLDWEKTLYLVIIILALATRLWAVGDRVQSHDESIHTKYSWNLYKGLGFQHNPLMHGPFLFEATAVSYFLFGDNDFSARVPVALMGVAVVAFPYLLRRWLGRKGALATSFFLLISPSIAYYSRYIRHDIPIILWSLIVILAMFSYLRQKRERWLYVMAAGVSLMFATKEVAFIYNAIFGIFLIGMLVIQNLADEWRFEEWKMFALIALGVLALGLLIVGGDLILGGAEPPPVEPVTEGVGSEEPAAGLSVLGIIGGVVAGLGGIGLVTFMILGQLGPRELVPPAFVAYVLVGLAVVGIVVMLLLPVLMAVSTCRQQGVAGGEFTACVQRSVATTPMPPQVRRVLILFPIASILAVVVAWWASVAFRQYRAFDLIILLGTLCLPSLSAGLIKFGAGLDPIAYTPPTIYYSGAMMLEMFLLSVGIGLVWDWQQREESEGVGGFHWLISAAVFYAIFVVLFTTVFTNGNGIATGLVGSLGYWLKQQGVKRGGQPWYYYFLTVSVYEFLPLLLTLAAPVLVVLRGMAAERRSSETDPRPGAPHPPAEGRSAQAVTPDRVSEGVFLSFAWWWLVTSWVGYIIAGEKMPWLTVHLALPMILISGWAVGWVLDRVDWARLREGRAWLLVLLVPPLVAAIVMFVQAANSGPFQGVELAQLDVTGKFLGGLLGVLAFGAGTAFVLWRGGWRAIGYVALFLALLGLVFLTARASWRFCYITDEYPTEYLVYAHAGPAVSDTMEQIDELSRRTAGGPNLIKVAYGADGSTLWYWQLRNYPNAVYFGDSPSRDQLDAPVVIAGRSNWDAVEPYVGNDYVVNTYTYLWWPMEDYRNMTWERIRTAIVDPDVRAAIWDIWYDRDYEKYDQLTNKTHTLDHWPLRSDYRLYIRRDVAAQVWDLGATELIEAAPPNPYDERLQVLTARVVFGTEGDGLGQFRGPRGVAAGGDGTIYVVDTGNSRVQAFAPDGTHVASWGGRSSFEMETGGPQGFLEPWGIAVDGDGFVYVADTWNHRIQKLDPEGNLVAYWGTFGQYGPGDVSGNGAFYGPRDVAVAGERVYVSDTGNKRVQVFDLEGNYVTQWGGCCVGDGQLDEPVGIAVGPEGSVYVADTWNRRVQVFSQDGAYLRKWSIAGWDGGLAEEKPYLAVDGEGFVYVTDPGHYRVLVFDSWGNYVSGFGQYGFDLSSFAFPTGIDIGPEGDVYVTDAEGNRVLAFDPLVLSGPREAEEGVPD